jgi:transcriptional regulator with XRE-family HTH domain
MIILRNLEAERIRHGLTQNQLAEKLGVTPRTIYSWIRQETPIPSNSIIAMCNLWNVSSDYLLSIDKAE